MPRRDTRPHKAWPPMVRPIEIEAMRNDGLSLAQIARNLQLMRWMNGESSLVPNLADWATAVAISLLIYDTFLILGDEARILTNGGALSLTYIL